ncbi:unnamed protein product [Ambrosiozyma monospora]|uniref:Unnamed protein product n=1 Tax=Ambrosiozyma monospora TaxID=43982 RepID=A0ACB5TBI6_AMBMO|nr:unnamed protein product [Ambrosiozyma monospora]
MSDYDPAAWTMSSNDSLFISLAEPTRALTFNPEFTYPIFGEAEQIFGYKDLRINLAFDCESLKPFIGVKFSSKVSEDVKKLDEELLKFLPKDDVLVQDEIKWLDSIEQEKFEKPGVVVGTYPGTTEEDEDFVYEIRKFKPSEGGNGLSLHKRMQIFVLLFIEAGSYIEADDPIWDVYVVYKTPKNGGKSSFKTNSN